MAELDNPLWRRAFQLAHLSEELAVASEHLGDQARAIADAAARLAESSEELVKLNPLPGTGADSDGSRTSRQTLVDDSGEPDTDSSHDV